jgi:prephenate dehydrogenase
MANVASRIGDPASRAAADSARPARAPGLDSNPVHVTFLGLGLIGGSVALALREAGGWTAAAWSPSGAGPARARAGGVIQAAPPTLDLALADADLVVLAAPPTVCLALLDQLAGEARAALPRSAVVTDVASTKALLVARAVANGLRFVGGHPMAGRETSGFGAATADLFVARPWVVVPGDLSDTEAIERVEALARATGAHPVRMDAGAHDAAVAVISHLPIVAAAALVEAAAGAAGEPLPLDWPAAAALAASGWRDATRLARGDARMGAGIAATNAAALAARVRAYRDRLDAWLALLETSGPDGLPDEAAIRDRLDGARNRLGHAG